MTAGNAAVALGQLLRFKVFAVTLGVGGLGLIAQVVALQGLLLSLSPVFSGIALLTVLSRARAVGASEARRALGAARSLALLSSGVAVAVALAASLLLAEASGITRIAELAVLGAVGAPFGALALVETVALQERRRFGSLAAANATAAFLSLGVVAILAAGLGPHGAALGLSVAWLIGWLVSYGLHERRAAAPSLSIDMPSWRELWHFGLGNLAASLVAALAAMSARGAALLLSGEAGAGTVQALLVVSLQVLYLLSASLGAYGSARVTALAARGDLQGMRQEINEVLRLGATFGALILAIALFARPLVTIAFSERFAMAADLLPIQLVGDLFRVHAWLAGLYLLPMGFRRVFVGLETLWHLTFVGGALALHPIVGLAAFPVAYAIASGALAALVSWHAWRTLGLAVARVLPLAIAAVGVIGLTVSPIVPLAAAAGLIALATRLRPGHRR